MTTVYDVPPEILIKEIAAKLKSSDKFRLPEKLKFVKTGTHAEKAPVQQDWWYTRVASVLRKIYINQYIGVSRLAAYFGGARDRRTKPDSARKGSRAILRHALKQLEEAGYVLYVKGMGRTVSPAGRSFLDNTTHEIIQKLVKEIPELAKY